MPISITFPSYSGLRRQIARAGFAVPDILVTTNAEAVRAFMREHGRIIYKSCSGVRSIVSTFAADQIGRLKRVGHCPTQFQEYVPGTDVRVHVVGEEVFATQINSTRTLGVLSAKRLRFAAELKHYWKLG